MPIACDNKSVGLIVENSRGEIAIILRTNFPQVYACPAGHITGHSNSDDPKEAAVDVLGGEVQICGLNPILVLEKEYQNHCTREGGTHHRWYIFKVIYDGQLTSKSAAAKGVNWRTHGAIQGLIQRTKDYRSGKITEAEWLKNPGFEDVWIDIFEDLKIL